ncbi:MAG: hypothetical protein NC907_03705 [Candidatus Omnitrophica bacterium]|nr:hypothetical protein [Candidatus Omnitrophota bacterium]
MTDKKNIVYRVLALGIASLYLAGKKGKEILETLEKEVKDKNLEEKIEKQFSGLIEKIEKAGGVKKEKIADVFGLVTKKEIENLRKEIENLKHGKQ